MNTPSPLKQKAMFTPSMIGFLANPYYILRRELYRAISDLSRGARGRLLDFGCGSKPYRALFPEVSMYLGCDIPVSGHSHATSRIDCFYDGRTLPFADETFDWVFTSETFEHIFNLDDIVAELNRVMKKGGRLLLTAPFCWDEHEVPYDFARYTSFGLTHILNKGGFEVITYRKTGTYILAIAQMVQAYLYQHVFPARLRLKTLLTPVILSPLTLLAWTLNAILPKRNSFFMNSVVLCEKR